MPIGAADDFLNSSFILTLLRVSILLILSFYAIFALLIVRQVDIMSKTLITPVSPLVRAIAIVHAGFAIGFAVVAWGVL